MNNPNQTSQPTQGADQKPGGGQGPGQQQNVPGKTGQQSDEKTS